MNAPLPAIPELSAEEFDRITTKWMWGVGGELTNFEHYVIDTWLGVKPVPLTANGLTQPENDLIAQMARRYKVSIGAAEKAYRSFGRKD